MFFDSGDTVQTIVHNCEIVWLQLNPRATHLLFCDRKGRLQILDLDSQVKIATTVSMQTMMEGRL